MLDIQNDPLKNSFSSTRKRSLRQAAAGGEDPRLGTTVKSVGRFLRFEMYRHQRHAAALLGKTHKVGLCKWSVNSISDGVSVKLKTHENGDRTAYYEGLQTCASVWVCPCCGARISSRRRGEMNDLLSWARSQKYAVFMVTLTARHGFDDDLAALLDAIKLAKKRLHQHRAWRRLKPQIIGSVTATEVTYGSRNGWHPHYHMLLIVEKSEGVADQLRELESVWLASLAGAGLSGNGAAFDLQNASGAKNYIAKWGAAEEITLNRHKKGRRAGRTPGQLLSDSCDRDDVQAGRLWVRFTEVFKGRRQLVWSRGLKKLVGIDEVEDEEAAEVEVEDPELLVKLTHRTWSSPAVAARRRRGAILNAAESAPETLHDVIADVDHSDADYERELQAFADEAAFADAVFESEAPASSQPETRFEESGERAQGSAKIGPDRSRRPRHLGGGEARTGPHFG